MRKKVVHLLKDPNNHQPGFKLFGSVVHRGTTTLTNLTDQDLDPEDNIEKGLLISVSGNTAYPIEGFVAILLNDSDVDLNHHRPLLESFSGSCPPEFQQVLNSTLDRLAAAQNSADGTWNREEMKYYDKEVATEEQRNKMLKAIREVPVWRIFLPRKKHIIDVIAPEIKNEYLLEIGSGNSRTVSWEFNPSKFNYNYIGSDISFKRLLVAKQAIPSGDFFQASALNLPFLDNSFRVVLSFGMLHHLPRPEDAVKSSYQLVKDEGLFAFHEPIIKPELKLPGMDTFRKTMTTYEHSDHDGKIDFDQISALLKSYGFKQISIHRQISIFRSFSETIIKNISRSILNKQSVIKTIEFLDEIPLNTLGRISRRAGASAVFSVFRKTSK